MVSGKQRHLYATLVFLLLFVGQASAFAGGNGTASNPYEISNVDQLQNMSSNLSAHYELIEDINASETRNWNNGKGFNPVGYEYGEGSWFSGRLDGQGHTISDLYINRNSSKYIGLFGYLGGGGNIENVALVNANITGKDEVSGNIRVGALVGKIYNFDLSSASISNSYSTGSVSSEDTAGGLVGTADSADLSNVYSMVDVEGRSSVGGLVGGFIGSDSYEISSSYSTGNISGSSDVGGLVGYEEPVVTNSYWNINTSGQNTSAGGTGLSTTEMTGLDAKSSLSGLDFSGTWSIVEDENQGYPFPEVFCGTEFDCSKPPSIQNVAININESNSSRNLNFSLSSRWQQDIASYQGLSSVTAFTNSSLEASLTLPFSASISVTDFTGLSSQTRSVDIDRSDSGHRQDPKGASLSTQYLNQTYTLSNEGTDPVNYSLHLDLPGTLDSENQWNGKLNAGSSTTHTVESQGDWIEEDLHELEAPDEVTLGKAFTGYQDLEVAEQAGVSWENVSTSGVVDTPTECSQNNATQISVPAGKTVNKTVGFSCSSGSIGTPTESLYDHGDYERAWYNTTLTVASNLTENSNLVWQVNKSKLPSYSEADPGSLEASVNGKSEDVTVVEGDRSIEITVQDDFGNSSLHEGSHSAALSYTVPSSDDDNSTNTSELEHSITFSVSEYYTKTAGGKSDVYFTAVNHRDTANTLYLETRDSLACSYFTIQSSYIGKNFGKKSNLRLAGRETGDNSTGKAILKAKVDLPNRTTIRQKGLGDTFTCRFKTRAGIGTPERLNLTVKLVDRKPQIVHAVEELVDTFLPELPDSALFEKEDVCFGPIEEAQQYEETGKGCDTGKVLDFPIPTGEGAAIIIGGLVFSVAWIRYL